MYTAEYLIKKSNECIAKALDALCNGDVSLARFYNNAASGFNEKMLKLTLNNTMEVK